ncbi:UTP--glucose-1-phosphate uridylyltransferase, partial [Haemophilus influenzae]
AINSTNTNKMDKMKDFVHFCFIINIEYCFMNKYAQ